MGQISIYHLDLKMKGLITCVEPLVHHSSHLSPIIPQPLRQRLGVCHWGQLHKDATSKTLYPQPVLDLSLPVLGVSSVTSSQLRAYGHLILGACTNQRCHIGPHPSLRGVKSWKRNISLGSLLVIINPISIFVLLFFSSLRHSPTSSFPTSDL